MLVTFCWWCQGKSVWRWNVPFDRYYYNGCIILQDGNGHASVIWHCVSSTLVKVPFSITVFRQNPLILNTRLLKKHLLAHLCVLGRPGRPNNVPVSRLLAENVLRAKWKRVGGVNNRTSWLMSLEIDPVAIEWVVCKQYTASTGVSHLPLWASRTRFHSFFIKKSQNYFFLLVSTI